MQGKTFEKVSSPVPLYKTFYYNFLNIFSGNFWNISEIIIIYSTRYKIFESDKKDLTYIKLLYICNS